jgi:hypothetical protein
MTEPNAAGSDVRPLRILEIGDNELFIRGVPEQTEYYWAAVKPRGRAGRAFGPVRLIRSLMRLRRREYDLLVVHAAQYAPWHPRSILTTLRDWHILSPLGLFAIFAWRFVHLFHDVPIVVLDLGDSCLVGRHNFFLLDSCKAFFKRELPGDNWLVFCKSSYPNFPGTRWRSRERNRRRVEKLTPISYGTFAFAEEFSSPVKQADIFFSGSVAANSTVRVAGLVELRALAQDGYIVDMPSEPLARPDFLRRMSQAWLAWSPGGLGWDCGRHYEAALVGCVPLMNYPTILRDRPLRDGEHCVLYAAEPGGLTQAAHTALADKPRLRQMAQAAAEHVRKHHTDRARAEHVTVTVLGRRLDGSWIAPVTESPAGVEPRAAASP